MTFLNKNYGDKPSLIKPIAIIVIVLLVIGGAYSFLGKKSDSASENADKVENNANEEQITVKPSGLDADMKVENAADVEKVIAKWVEANPQAIIQAVANMQKKMMEEKEKMANQTIGSKKNELLNDKNSPSYSAGNYDVTIVEFFDYSCGYCKVAQNTLETLLNSDSKVRIIYKELPVLGQASVEMAQVSVAVSIVSQSSYKKFHDALMKSNARGKDAAFEVVKKVGINLDKVKDVMKNDSDKISKILEANSNLSREIGINGTPAFVIGDEFISGALDLAGFKDKVANARKK